MKISLGCDHAGFDLKEYLKEVLSKDHEIVDCGTYSSDSVDYPEYSFKAAEKVASGECDLGITICGSGIGSSIAANKVKGIRAALCHSTDFARLSREHNNANILVLPGRFIAPHYALEIVKVWLNTPYSNEERHNKRIKQIKDYEERG